MPPHTPVTPRSATTAPKTWFSSDQHFGHRNIIRYCDRPFPDTMAGIEEMGDWLVDAWNSVVQPQDTVYVLGDFALGTLARTLPVTGRLVGTKILVAGNHDRCWEGRKHYQNRIAPYLDAGFTEVTQAAIIATRHGDVNLSHFPYRGDHSSRDRYTKHRPIDDGGWLIHGHVHQHWRQKNRQINVGVDAWAGHPVSLDTIETMMDAGEQFVERIPW